MKSLGLFSVSVLACLVVNSVLHAKEVLSEINPPQAGVISADRVNVRARASLIGERVTQLRKGDQVTVLAKVIIAPPRDGEPGDWLKIAMPAAGQTWVHMSFIDEGDVTASKLNVRAGGGERFSIVGRLVKGDTVKEKRVAGDWIEIEHPPGAYAYIATKFVRLGQEEPSEDNEAEVIHDLKPAQVSKPGESPSPQKAGEKPSDATLETKPETGDVVTAIEQGKDQSEPEFSEEDKAEAETNSEPTGMPEPPAPEEVVVDSSNGAESSETQTPPMGNPEDAREAKPEESIDVSKTELPVPPPRIVTREGTIKRRFFRSPKAPSRFELLDDNGRTINYLYSSDSGPLKTAAGADSEPITFERLMSLLRNRRVILTGIEAVDPRWPSLPLLDVRTLKTVP